MFPARKRFHLRLRCRVACFLPLACCLTLTTASAHAAQPASVILISIDTLRADHLSAYGYRRIQTPNIDSFAQHGTLFTSINSQIPLTLPSHTSLFTSTYPFENQIEENAQRVPANSVTLAATLRSRGYMTAAFVSCVFLERQMGLDQGFDFYDSPFRFEVLSPLSGSMFFGGSGRNPYAVRDRRDGGLAAASAARWLAANRNQPVFVFLHLFDLHKPYRLSPAVARPRGVSDYDAALLYVDRVLGAFKQTLIRQGLWERSLVVVLSDHGEGLGDHGESSHGYFIYQSTLWVPLIFHWPAGAGAHAPRAGQPAGLIDVAPTILDFLHLPPPPSFEGKSLLGAINAGPNARPRAVYSESLHTYHSFGWSPLRSLRVGSVKYIEAPHPELYDLQTDPRELHNLYRADSSRAVELRGQLARLLASRAPKHPATPAQVSPSTRALLGSLGYLSGGPRSSLQTGGPDPKDRLAEFRLYERAQAALADRRLIDATALLRRIVAEDPHNILALRDLGGCYLDRQLYRDARSCLRRVLAAAPDDYVALYQLGSANERLGLLKEAVENLRAACKIEPGAEQCRAKLRALEAQTK